jgi:predicted metal-dependent phosphoesterase TrpH
MFRGVIHCHSTYSDGEFSLRELRATLTAAGFDFVCMTDHAEAFDGESLRAYVEECEALSDARFRFVAGLEFECERRMHVLGYGVTALAGATDPQEVIRHIAREGGVSVIAHPMDSMFPWVESFEALPDGIEAWNSKYDGRYAPRPGTFRLLRRLQERKPEMRAFYGTDLHWRKQFRGLTNVLRCESPTRAGVLGAFRSGDYFATKGGLELPSDGLLPETLMRRFGRTNALYHRARRLLKETKRASGRLGKNLPAPVKAQLRRIF